MVTKKVEAVEVPTQVQEEPVDVAPVETETMPVPVEEPVKKVAPVVRVLNRYRIEKKNDDVFVYERIKLPPSYANEKGVLKFEAPNGNTTYYTEKLVKKYSDNVVSA